jgi:hypothetical protein
MLRTKIKVEYAYQIKETNLSRSHQVMKVNSLSFRNTLFASLRLCVMKIRILSGNWKKGVAHRNN